jgi:hypothetical protein
MKNMEFSMVFGNFDFRIPVVFINNTKEELSSEMNRMGELGVYAKELNILTKTSGVHEIRHFFDFFGTFSGISIWFEYINMLQEFVSFSENLYKNGLKWSQIMNQSKAPKVVLRYKSFQEAIKKYKSPFSPFRVKNIVDDNYYVLVSDKIYGEVKAYAHSILINIIKEEVSHEIHPIGFEALLEGNAYAVQRNFGQTDDLMLKRMTLKERTLASYNLTDLLISKYIRKYGKQFYNRDSILGITDLALSELGILHHYVPIENVSGYEIVGRLDVLFVDFLEKQPIDNILSGKINYPDEITIKYQNFVNFFKSQPNIICEIDVIESPKMSLEIVKSFVIHNIIVPILEERLRSKHTAFSTSEGFYNMWLNFGNPPFFISKSGINEHRVPVLVSNAWKHLAMIQQIVDQITSNQSIIWCPRANPSVGFVGIEFINYVLNGKEDCSQWINRGCGEWSDGANSTLPNCFFNTLLTLLAVK